MRRTPSALRLAAGLAAAVAACTAFAGDPSARSTGTWLSSYQVAGFIQYVRWPGDADLKRWEVCVAAPGTLAPGNDLGSSRGRPVAVRVLGAGEGLQGCHIADLTAVPASGARALLERTRGLPVLTIGEGERFCSAGGVICTRPVGAGGGFEVNLSALQDAGLNANAQLLMLGRRRQTAGAAP